jgi:hypothetical protein
VPQHAAIPPLHPVLLNDPSRICVGAALSKSFPIPSSPAPPAPTPAVAGLPSIALHSQPTDQCGPRGRSTRGEAMAAAATGEQEGY